MAAQENALDIPEQQVAVDFPDDQFFTWHVHVLVTQLGDGGRWVSFSPDFEPEVVDLADHRVVPLVRGAAFPQHIRGDAYYRVNITEDDLTNTVQECRALAAVLGVTGPNRPTTVIADWVYADPAFDRFSQVVGSSLAMTPATMLARDSVALVRVGADDGVECITAQRIDPARRHGPVEGREALGAGQGPTCAPAGPRGRSRTLSLSPLRRRRHHLPGAESPRPGLALSRPVRGQGAPGSRVRRRRGAHRVPRLLPPLQRVEPGPRRRHQAPRPAGDHAPLPEVYDQVNAGRFAGMEAIARYMLQIRQAVRPNPKNPDFKGTSVFTLSHLGSSGGVLTGDFARYVADEQKSHAFMLKQHRLYAEEEEKRRNAKNTENAGGGGGKPK